MKRYKLVQAVSLTGVAGMKEDPNGPWIRFADLQSQAKASGALSDKEVFDSIARGEKAIQAAKDEMRRRGYEQTPIGNWVKK